VADAADRAGVAVPRSKRTGMANDGSSTAALLNELGGARSSSARANSLRLLSGAPCGLADASQAPIARAIDAR